MVGPDDGRVVGIRSATLADVPAIARVHVDGWRETYPGLIPDAVLAALTYEERESLWTDTIARAQACVFVAHIENAIVAFASGGPNRDEAYVGTYPGELYSIYVLQRFHGHGIGRRLFEAVHDWLRAHELEKFILWTVAANPACAFYQRMGGTLIVTQPADIRGARIFESGYAWG